MAHDADAILQTMNRGFQNLGFLGMTSPSQIFFDRNRGSWRYFQSNSLPFPSGADRDPTAFLESPEPIADHALAC